MTTETDWKTMPRGLVRTRKENRVAWLLLDAPPANNYSPDMMRDLDEAILEARFDGEVDVLVLAGEGDKFFCSGADIQALAGADPDWKYAFCLHANETMLRLENTPKLVIAALNGHCVGGGLEVALACDLRLGRRPAEGGKESRFGLPEVNLGVLPGTGGTQRLSRLLGPDRALAWMAEGRLVGPDEALAEGLLHRLLDFEGFFAAVQEFAEGFCVPRKAAKAVGHIKRAVRGGTGLPLEAGLALERELQQRLFESRDAAEGIAAFLEKRPPEFEGC